MNIPEHHMDLLLGQESVQADSIWLTVGPFLLSVPN